MPSRPVEFKIRSLTELEDLAVHPRVMGALRATSNNLHAAGVRHAALGAIAVGVHGWPRATSNVELLLGPEAWTEAPDGSLTPNIPMPETVNGVGVDYLHVGIAGDFLIDAFASAHISEGVPIARVEVVILTKLIRLVTRDHADIVELLKAGLFDPSMVETYLETHAPMLTPRFRVLAEQAKKEKLRG
ncbi:MAG TPA: hypothetical protein VL137_02605 [Polyangiaceae bacterium]|nr:hypothetical protein [Polyangiaceae bacterium]